MGQGGFKGQLSFQIKGRLGFPLKGLSKIKQLSKKGPNHLRFLIPSFFLPLAQGLTILGEGIRAL